MNVLVGRFEALQGGHGSYTISLDDLHQAFTQLLRPDSIKLVSMEIDVLSNMVQGAMSKDLMTFPDSSP